MLKNLVYGQAACATPSFNPGKMLIVCHVLDDFSQIT